MRNICSSAIAAAFLVVLLHSAPVAAGQMRMPDAPPPMPNLSAFPPGLKFCPAPGADNSEFNSSYYAVDARTGEMTRYMDGAPRNEPFGPVDAEEQVLYVSPPISVENRYVPYPGAAPQEPPPAFRRAPARNPERDLHAYTAPAVPDPRVVRTAPPPRDKQRRDSKLPWWKAVLH